MKDVKNHILTDEMRDKLLSTFSDDKVWTCLELDCALPDSYFYAAAIDEALRLEKVS